VTVIWPCANNVSEEAQEGDNVFLILVRQALINEAA
jgi:hypothetical protein